MGGVRCHRAETASGFDYNERQLAADAEAVGVRAAHRPELFVFPGPTAEPLVAGRRHRRGVHSRQTLLFPRRKMTPGSSAIVTVAFGHSTEHLDYTFLSFAEKNPGVPLHAF